MDERNYGTGKGLREAVHAGAAKSDVTPNVAVAGPMTPSEFAAAVIELLPRCSELPEHVGRAIEAILAPYNEY